MTSRTTLLMMAYVVGSVVFTTTITFFIGRWVQPNVAHWGPVHGILVVANHFVFPSWVTYRVTRQTGKKWVWTSVVFIVMFLMFAFIGITLAG